MGCQHRRNSQICAGARRRKLQCGLLTRWNANRNGWTERLHREDLGRRHARLETDAGSSDAALATAKAKLKGYKSGPRYEARKTLCFRRVYSDRIARCHRHPGNSRCAAVARTVERKTKSSGGLLFESWQTDADCPHTLREIGRASCRER